MTARLTVLASGGGSNLQALLDACADGHLDAEVVLVVSDTPQAGALARATAAGVATVARRRDTAETRAGYDEALAQIVADSRPDLIVLAGWMRLLSMSFLGRFPRQVINLHPALPGQLPGLQAIERAHAEAVAGRRTATGVMVHFVPDEGVDDGPVVATATVAIDPNEPLAMFATRMHHAEHRLLVEAVDRVISSGSDIDLTSMSSHQT